MAITTTQAKRVHDLIADGLGDRPGAWDKLHAYLREERLTADDLALLSEAVVGGVEPVDGVGRVGLVERADTPSGSDLGATNSEEEDYILDWLRREEVRCTYDQRLSWRRDRADPSDPLWHVGRKPLSMRRVVRALTVEVMRDGLKIPLRIINAVLADWQDDQRRADARAVYARISLVGEAVSVEDEARGRAALKDLCRHRLDDDLDYATAVILTIIHQGKRKLLGLPIDNHLVFLLHSSAGATGKSEFLKALLRPLTTLCVNINLDELLDNRMRAVWDRYYINLDDVDESAAKKRGQFRRCITQHEWANRTLGTGEIGSVSNNATIVGSTHHRVWEIMPDTYSMRRFAELHGRETPPDAEAIAALDQADMVMIWRSVDPYGPRPIDKLGFAAILRERQEAARLRGPVEQWLDEFAPTDPTYARRADANGWIRASELYEYCYKRYVAANLGPEGRLTLDSFGKQLRALLTARGPRAPLEYRHGRRANEYRFREVEAETAVASTTPPPADPPSESDATRH